MVRKLYIDARAKKEGSYGDFTWQSDRPIIVEKCRAFIDSVHIPNVFGCINSTNQYVYLTEEQADFTVLAGNNKIYLEETPGGERIITLAAGLYTEATLASQLQTQLGGAYTVTSGTGTLQISNNTLTSWKIFSRAELQTKISFAGQAISATTLQDASDLLGNTIQAYLGPSHNATLGTSKFYRRVAIATGQYSHTDLASALQTALNSNTKTLPQSYVVTADQVTGKLDITNASSLLFEIYPETYMTASPKSFMGYSAPYHAADHAIGFTQLATGNTVKGDNHISVMRYHTLFINSDLGHHNDSIGPLSQSSIARKVTIDQPHGSMIHDFHSLPYDYIQLDKQSITSIRFRLTDWQGNSVDMESPWSLSVILMPEEEF